MMNKSPLLCIAVFLLVATVSATVTCDPSQISVSFTQGDAVDSINTLCGNDANGSVSIDYTGQYFSITETTIGASPSQKSIEVSFDNNAPSGNHFGSITFNGSAPIPVFMSVTENAVQQGDILTFPTSKVVTVQQDAEKTQSILISVPENYPRIITIQSVDFNPGTETILFGDLDLGQLSPGQSTSIPIVFTGKDAAVGSYQTNLNIFATDSEGQIDFPTISLTLQVTSGVSPIDSTTFSTKPACSLSSSNMNLNNSYTFVCSGVVNNLDVEPEYNQFFEGITVDFSSNIYTYTFKPVKFGNTDFIALFSHRGTPIFSPFSQEVRISSASGQIAGTSLRVLFTPDLSVAKKGERVAIQLIDNKTDTLVETPSIEIDAIPITNKSGKTFFFEFDVDKNYSLRGSAPGYNDLVKSITLLEKPIKINIDPSVGNTNTIFNVSTDVNATITINGIDRGSSYRGTLITGTNEIKATKDGFTDTSKNLTVDSSITFFTNGEFKKGVLQTITLNKNTSWTVNYQKDKESPIETLLSGTGNKIEFEPKKTGIYTLSAEDASREYEIEGWDWKKKWWFMEWFWWIGILAIIIGYFYFRGGTKTTSSEMQIPIGGG